MYDEQAIKETSKFMEEVKGEYSRGYALLIYHKQDNQLIDISTLVGDIVHTTSLQDSPAKLTFFVQKDNKEILSSIHNGDLVMFQYYGDEGKGVGIFKGYVFNIGIDATDVFKITAYDQTRYLKNEDSVILKKMTVSQIFEKICKENELKYNIVTPIDYVPPKKIYHAKTLYSILRECMQKAEVDTWKKSGGKNSIKYMIRDNYGTLELLSIDKLKTNIIIGNESHLSSFQFETSIDKGTYNRFKLVQKVNVEGEKKNETDTGENTRVYQFPTVKTNFISQWGILQKVMEVDEHMNKAQLIEKAQNLLKSYCRETKTLSLSALGIMGMNAGVGFKCNIPSINANLDMYILEATHKYSMDFHTMDLTVNANDLEIYWK